MNQSEDDHGVCACVSFSATGGVVIAKPGSVVMYPPSGSFIVGDH